ncbi:MAG: hypothetical protein GXY20_09065 [Clostridiales bacterium]|jgi:hypothetical protein|nr:hypothetical protein [Clostridiales bacterium]
MVALPHIKTKEELVSLVNEIGYLPFITNELTGFSVMELTDRTSWFTDDYETDPWYWRSQIAGERTLVYAKLFSGRAGFVSREWYPLFANYRRNGYDFDTLFEAGAAPRRQKLIMDLFPGCENIPSYVIKKLCGFGKDGEKGFEGALTALQMQTYLVISGFSRRRNKKGFEYGWAYGEYATPEALFGTEHVTSLYGCEPADSFAVILERCSHLNPGISREALLKFLR